MATTSQAAEATPAQPPLSRVRLVKRIIRIAALLFALAVLWLVVTAPLSRSLGPVAAPSITILSAEGEPIARRGAIIGAPVDVMRLPPHVGQAFIAIEDRRFFRHVGIDPWGIGRAIWRDLRAGRMLEGGSTISQQLAKTSFLSPARTADPQGAGGADRAVARGLALQGGDPQPLSLQRLFRRQRLRPARRRPPLFQRRSRAADARPGGDAGRGRQRAEPAGADHRHRDAARAAPRLVLGAMREVGYIDDAQLAAARPPASAAARATTCPPAPISPIGCCPRRPN